MESSIDIPFAADELGQDIHNRVFAAICCLGRKIGFACYDELSNEIIADGIEASSEDMESILVNIKLSCNPTLFLVHPQIIANKSLLDLLLSDISGKPEAYRYKAIKSSSWNAEHAITLMTTKLCIKKLSTEQSILRNTPEGTLQQNYFRLAAVLDLDNQSMKQAISALLTYMQTSIFNMDGGFLTVSSIRQLPLPDYMRVDQGSLSALQIFCEDTHPNIIKGVGRSKEGFSLFGLFDRTHSIPGRSKLREWMSKPFYDRTRIINRQNGIAVMIRAENSEFIRNITEYLRKVYDMPRILLRIKKVEASPAEWSKLYVTLQSSIPLLELLENFSRHTNNEDDLSYVSELLAQCNIQVVRQVYELLHRSLDFSISRDSGVLTIREEYDDQLDQLRSLYDRLEDVLTDAATMILQEIPLLSKLSVEYVPQIGYLVAIDMAEQHFLGPTDFDFIYAQEDTSYYKHRVVYELDDGIGDIKANILDRQKSLVLEVEDTLLEAEYHLQQLSVMLSTLDATLSLGIIAKEMDFVKPEIVDEDVIIIKNGRHPLQQLAVDRFVPNDTFISSEKNIALITGPNSSGKSVYLKQVGLLVYLAHIGSWLPCERAIIGLTDKIFTRIASVESASTPQSAFSLDLNQISKMLSNHTPRSLCLIDEFGKGTSPLDGIALLASTIRHFAVHKTKAMFVLHFTEVFHEEVIGPQYSGCISKFRMDTHQPSEDEELGESNVYLDATPLYKLQVGIATSSEGLSCARLAGVSENILTRAKNVKEMISQRQPISAVSFDGSQSQSLLKDEKFRKLLIAFLEDNDWSTADSTSLNTIRSLVV